MTPFDPVTLEVYWQRLISIAEEQAKALTRTAFSSQAGEMEDISSGIFDARGRMIAQGVTGTVGVITALVRGVPQFLEQYPPQELSPGDVLISNDPWMLAGHLNDIAILVPVFHGDRLVAFTATMSHATDIGGRTWSSDNREVYEEGIWIPPMKLYRKGEPQSDLLRLLERNVRVPEQVIGDVMAQIVACNVGARKVQEFCTDEGLYDLAVLSETILDRSEQAVRKAIASIPPCTHRSTVQMDGPDQSLTIEAALTIDSDGIVVDFTGSAPQIAFAINCVLNYTLAHTVYPVKCALCPEVPNNEGCFRPIRVNCPPGLLLNAVPPAPLVSRHVVSSYINAAVMNALSRAVPNAAIAESGANGMPLLSGIDERTREPFVYWFLCNGGMGARPIRDGLNTVSFPANIATVSAEIIENASPVIVLRKEIANDTGGPGKFRGGCGSELELRVRGGETLTLSPVYDRCDFPANGVHGGLPGAPTRISVNGKPIASKKRTSLGPGDVFAVRHGGGGGFLPPQDREVAQVLEDVQNGYVSVDVARSIYKVVIDAKTGTIDLARTRDLRAGKL